jgi:C4-dicarboxylate transporter DctM subunit
MILYGVAAEQSIPKLFVAGILPGLLIALMMAGFIVWIAWRRGIRTTAGVGARDVLAATSRAALALAMPVFVLGGIYGGFFSPTEAGGFAAAYAILIGTVVYRSLGLAGLIDAAGHAAMLTAKIMIVVAAASAIAWLLTVQGVPQALSAGVSEAGFTALGFLVAVNLLLLAVGCFLDPTSSILVLAPLLTPIAIGLGIDPIHFGVVMTVNLAIGMFTPPFGLNIFVAQAVMGVSAAVIWRGVLPFMVVQLIALAIITAVPELSLLLTRTMG